MLTKWLFLTVMETAVVHADEAAAIVDTANPAGPVVHHDEAMHCDGAALPAPAADHIAESVIADQSPRQKLPVSAATRTSPYDIAPIPHAPQRVEGTRKRKSESSTILTSTPHKEYLKSRSAKKPPKKQLFTVQSKKRAPRIKKPAVSSSADTTPCCICEKRFNEPPADSWTQCPQCTKWYHDSCGPEDTVVCYLCLA